MLVVHLYVLFKIVCFPSVPILIWLSLCCFWAFVYNYLIYFEYYPLIGLWCANIFSSWVECLCFILSIFCQAKCFILYNPCVHFCLGFIFSPHQSSQIIENNYEINICRITSLFTYMYFIGLVIGSLIHFALPFDFLWKFVQIHFFTHGYSVLTITFI